MMPFLGLTLILLIILSARLAYLSRSEAENEQAFWERERQANITVEGEKSMDDIKFVKPDLERFIPEDGYTSHTLAIQEELVALKDAKIANFDNTTNTQLKLDYGVQNLDKVQGYGENFEKLESILDRYIKSLMDEGKYQLAMEIAEYAIACKTDISSIYCSLIDCYYYFGKKNMITFIKESVEESEMTMKASVLRYIDDVLEQIEKDPICPYKAQQEMLSKEEAEYEVMYETLNNEITDETRLQSGILKINE